MVVGQETRVKEIGSERIRDYEEKKKLDTYVPFGSFSEQELFWTVCGSERVPAKLVTPKLLAMNGFGSSGEWVPKVADHLLQTRTEREGLRSGAH